MTEEIGDVKLSRGEGEIIVIQPLTPKGAGIIGHIFDAPNMTANSDAVMTEMPLFELLTRLSGCIIAMVDDEDPSKIYYIDDAISHLH